MTRLPGQRAGKLGPRKAVAPHAVVFLGAATLFSFVAMSVATKRSRKIDRRVRDWTQQRRVHALDLAAKPITYLSLPAVVVSGTLLLALRMKMQSRDRAALTLALTPLIGAMAGQSFTSFLPQQNPPDRHFPLWAGETEASFPSGHVTGLVAETLTIGYVLSREGLMSRRTAAFLAVWPMIVAAARVYRDRHWASDAVGGFLAGTAVAALATMVHNGRPEPTIS
jgi:membrane-associated phospholipid phosphatase